VVSTYQSITGTGVKAVEQLENEYAGVQGEMAYKYLFIEMQFHNVMCLKKTDTKEEMKLVRETQKILDDKTIVTATAVRVPIVGGHSEAVNVQQMTLKYQTFKVYYIIQMVLSYKTTMIYLSNANVCTRKR
jgi:aspartate-semialdehyde dehydrogenase